MERIQKKSSMGWLGTLCHLPLDSGADRESHRQEIVIPILMLTGAVVMIGASLWDIFVQSGAHWGNLTILAVGLLAAMSYIITLSTRRTSLGLTLGVMIFLHFFWLTTSGVELTGMLWCLVLLPLFFFLLGYKRGGVLVLTLFFASCIVLLLPNWLALASNYSHRVSTRFLLAYLVLCWLSFLLEYIRFQTRSKLRAVKDDLNTQARTDELTGLANRRGFKQYLGEAEQRGDKGESCAVIVADLDHFKQINDEYGHEVGDFVLQEIAKTLKAFVRSEDLIVRWGGEEFLILLVGTDLAGAQVLAEKIRQKVASMHFSTGEGEFAVSMSLGVDAQTVGGDLYATLGSADQAMYEAKHRGRNCVVVADKNELSTASQAELELPAKKLTRMFR